MILEVFALVFNRGARRVHLAFRHAFKRLQHEKLVGIVFFFFTKIWGEEVAFDIHQPLIVWQRRAASLAHSPSANQVQQR